jgi:hypothetical protein
MTKKTTSPLQAIGYGDLAKKTDSARREKYFGLFPSRSLARV